MQFLEKLTRQILLQNADLATTAIVLPSRRAGRILLNNIAKEKKSTFFAPTIFTIDDFIESLSPYQKISEEELIKRLFLIYKKTAYGNDKTFSVFYPWAETFLRDINEVDRQLVDAQAIFSNLSEIKDLEISFAKMELSDNQKKYLDFYKNLFGLYTQLNAELKNDKLAYTGGIYKDTALHIEEYAAKSVFEKIYFAGLSAFTPSEFKIIDYYLSSRKAEIYFDFDPFYENTSAFLLEKIRRNLGDIPIHWISNEYKTIEKKIKEVAVSGNFNQIYYAIQKIKAIEERDGTLDGTALVFADESLILPFLHAYPCDKVNLTMGYPFSETAAVQLVKQLIALVRNSFRFQEIRSSNQPLFYHKNMVALLENPIMISLLSIDKSTKTVLHQIKNRNKAFYTFEELASINKKIKWIKPEKGFLFIESVISFIQNMIPLFQQTEDHRYALQIVHQQLTEVGDFLKAIEQADWVDFNAIEYFFDKKIRPLSVPLRGEYDNGLQVMGLLESRALDFKNVILLSVNEGVLPNSNSQNSLILFDLKNHFGLPLSKEKDAVFAYHFFRLIQRAEDVTLIYDEDSSNHLAERSRFIAQLAFEIESGNYDTIKYEKERFTMNVSKKNDTALTIKKEPAILDILSTKVYSASLLAKYINCPLQFYFHAVPEVKPPLTITEEIEQNVMGTIIHAVLENIVNQIIKNPSDGERILDDALLAVRQLVVKEILKNKELKNMDMERGKPFLYMEIMIKSLTNYLQILKEEKSFNKFVCCEEKIIAEMDVDGRKIAVKGIIDRIDKVGDEVFILDYKTGKADKEEMKVDDIEQIFTSSKHTKVFQLLMYLYLFCKKMEDSGQKIPDRLTTGIISTVQLNKDKYLEIITPIFKDSEIEEMSPENLYRLFDEKLTALFSEILNPTIDFTQTSDENNCKFCDFQAICGRQTN